MKSKIVVAVLVIAAIVCLAYAMSNLPNADAAIAANGMGNCGLAAILLLCACGV